MRRRDSAPTLYQKLRRNSKFFAGRTEAGPAAESGNGLDYVERAATRPLEAGGDRTQKDGADIVARTAVEQAGLPQQIEKISAAVQSAPFDDEADRGDRAGSVILVQDFPFDRRALGRG